MLLSCPFFNLGDAVFTISESLFHFPVTHCSTFLSLDITKTVEMAGMAGVSYDTVWVLAKIFRLVSDMVVGYSQVQADIFSRSQLLRSKGLDDSTIEKALEANPYVLFSIGNKISTDLIYEMLDYTKRITDRVRIGMYD